MHVADTVIEARWVVPVRPRGVVLEHHALVIEDGRIAALLPSTQARLRYPALPRVVLQQHALLPGLVNAHTHCAMSLMRGVGDDLPLGRWLRERIWPLERAIVSAGFVHDGARLAARRNAARRRHLLQRHVFLSGRRPPRRCAAWGCAPWWAS